MGREKPTIGERLREERERLGYNQTNFAALASASKHSQIDWEKNTASPNTKVLAAFAKAGADVLYIVTGVRSVGLSRAAEPPGIYEMSGGPLELSKKEAALLDNYRNSEGEAQDVLIKTSAAFAQQQGGKIEQKPASPRKKPG